MTAAYLIIAAVGFGMTVPWRIDLGGRQDLFLLRFTGLSILLMTVLAVAADIMIARG